MTRLSGLDKYVRYGSTNQANSASYPQWDGEWVVYRLARWKRLLAAVSPSIEYLYKGKADVVYLQVTLCDPHLNA